MTDQAQTQEQPSQEPTQETEQTFSKADIAKIAEEANKYRALAKDYETKLKQREIEELTANQRWKELAELKEKEALEASEKAEKLKSAFVQKEKLSALKEAAILAGIRKESIPDLRLIDFPELNLQNGNDGDFNVVGADKAIQRLKSLRPHWFSTAAPSVNTQSPSVTGDLGGGGLDEIKKIQAEYQKNPTAANAEKYKTALLQFRQKK